MSRRVLLGIPDGALASQVAALAQEGLDVEVVDSVPDGDEVAAALNRLELDAVILHEDLGPLPVIDLARQLAAAYPRVGFLLLARELTPDLLRAALRAGVRDVVGLPLTLEALAEAIEGAATWSQAISARIDDHSLALAAESVGGRLVTLAGAKGGVGTTTLALHLALAAAAEDPERTVCLAEFDLQSGDLSTLLDLPTRRSVVDLAAVGDDIGARSLDDTLYVHSSGLRVLLAPDRGEDGEDVTGPAARRILGALKFQYDLVIVDAGALVTEGSAVATELADEVLIVTTPDVPALRAANRLLRLWERLSVRAQGTARVLLNQVHRDSEVQPDLAKRVLTADLTETTVPAGFRDLEPGLNTGQPTQLQGAVKRGIEALAGELGLIARRGSGARLRLRSSAGQASVETVGLTGLIVLLVIGLWQMALVGYTYVLAGHAARSAARSLAVGEDTKASAEADVPKPWRHDIKVDASGEEAKVTLRVPFVIPGIEGPITVSQSEGTVKE